MDTPIRLRLGINEFGVKTPFRVTADVRRKCMSIVVVIFIFTIVVVVVVVVVVHNHSPNILDS